MADKRNVRTLFSPIREIKGSLPDDASAANRQRGTGQRYRNDNSIDRLDDKQLLMGAANQSFSSSVFQLHGKLCGPGSNENAGKSMAFFEKGRQKRSALLPCLRLCFLGGALAIVQKTHKNWRRICFVPILPGSLRSLDCLV